MKTSPFFVYIECEIVKKANFSGNRLCAFWFIAVNIILIKKKQPNQCWQKQWFPVKSSTKSQLCSIYKRLGCQKKEASEWNPVRLGPIFNRLKVNLNKAEDV